MQEEATQAKSSDIEPTNAEQQNTSAAVTDAGSEAPSSSTVVPSSSLSSDEIANGYRCGFNRSLLAQSLCYKTKKFLLSLFVNFALLGTFNIFKQSLAFKMIDHLKLVYCIFLMMICGTRSRF